MFSIHPNKNWELYFRAQHLRLNGTRPKSTGTFARQGVGPAGDGVWESLGMELPEPVQYRTTNLTFGVQYSQPKWRIGLDYNVSLFRNEIPLLTWENPFRVTDAIAIAPMFAVGRNRFVRAQLDLPPNNDFESLSVHGSVDLPRETQFVANSPGDAAQDDLPQLPFNLITRTPPVRLLATTSVHALLMVVTSSIEDASSPAAWKHNKLLMQYRSNSRNNLSATLPSRPGCIG
jgi:hypothetical protein